MPCGALDTNAKGLDLWTCPTTLCKVADAAAQALPDDEASHYETSCPAQYNKVEDSTHNHMFPVDVE